MVVVAIAVDFALNGLNNFSRKLAGAAGIEPANGATKKRCLTTWPRPSTNGDLANKPRRSTASIGEQISGGNNLMMPCGGFSQLPRYVEKDHGLQTSGT